MRRGRGLRRVTRSGRTKFGSAIGGAIDGAPDLLFAPRFP